MIRTEKTHLKTFAGTHAGMSGKNNEDNYGVSAYLLDEETSTPVLFAVLADGIGGHNAGEVASAMVVDTTSQIISQSDGTSPLADLKEAVQSASILVHNKAQSDTGRRGMGSTVVCALIIGKQLYTAYVGDSRIYLIREKKIFRLTQDHSWVQEAIDSGLLTPEQAAGHPNSHVIRRYVGSPEPPEVDFRLRLNPNETRQESIDNQGLILKNGDKIFLCSDGLTDLVEDEEIYSLINNNDPKDVTDKLIALANQRGGHDNITTVLVQVPEGAFVEEKTQTIRSFEVKTKDTKSNVPVKTVAYGCLGIVLLISLIVAGYFGLQLLRGDHNGNSPTALVATSEKQGLVQETLTADSMAAPKNTPDSGNMQTDTPSENTVSASGGSVSSDGGSIPPPPDPEDMTPVPTNTLVPTRTSKNTITPISATPTNP